VEVDLLLDPFAASWPEMLDAALAAEQAGFGAIWTWDHLAGSVHGQSHVLECWTVLSALAAAVPRLMLGSLVLNPANRPAGTLAVMTATLQHVSGGRLLLGIGAGGGPDTPYASEQFALGREVDGDIRRRRRVEETIATLRQVWSGARNGVHGLCGRLAPAEPAGADHRGRLWAEDGWASRPPRRRHQRSRQCGRPRRRSEGRPTGERRSGPSLSRHRLRKLQ